MEDFSSEDNFVNEHYSAHPKKRAYHNPWLLTFVTVLAHMLSSGVSFSIGSYYVTFLEVFNKSHGVTSWVASLNLGILMASGPLSSLIIEKIGIRAAVQLGSVMSAVGIGLASLSVNIYMLLATLGMMTGLGYGIVYMCCVVSIGISIIPKYRSVAIAISFTGCSLGNIGYPYLAKVMLDAYGWRGAMLITSGLTLNICVFGLFIGVARKSTGKETGKVEKVQPAEARNLFRNEAPTAEGDLTAMDKRHIFGDSYWKLNRDSTASYIKSLPLIPSTDHSRNSEYIKHHSMDDISQTKYKGVSRQETSKAMCLKGSMDLFTMVSSKPKLNENIQPGVRNILPDATSQSPIQHSCYSKRLHMFTLYQYWLFLFSTSLFAAGYSVFSTHIMAYAESVGRTKTEATLLLALNGGGGIVGRLILGFLLQRKAISTFWLYVVCSLVTGATLVNMTVWSTYAVLIVAVIIYALSSASYGPVIAEAAMEICGLEHFNYGFGFILLSLAVGTILGAPIAGWVYDLTEDYRASFYFGSAVYLVSALVMVPSSVVGMDCWRKGVLHHSVADE